MAVTLFHDCRGVIGPKPGEEVRFVNVSGVVQLVRDIKLQAFVADLAVHDAFLRELLKLCAQNAWHTSAVRSM